MRRHLETRSASTRSIGGDSSRRVPCSKGLGSIVVRLKVRDGQLWMVAWYRDPKPDKGKKRVREPIEPAEALRATPLGNVEIKPNVEELIWTEAGYKVGLEA